MTDDYNVAAKFESEPTYIVDVKDGDRVVQGTERSDGVNLCGKS